MTRFAFHDTSIKGLHLFERFPIGDSRGCLERLFCQESLNFILNEKVVRQINRTLTNKTGVVRGLHYQTPPHAETKIVSCLKGKVWDVAVDLRQESPTFLQHNSAILSETNCRSFIIPEGFAHGFQALVPNCELLYLHTADYKPECEGGLNILDPRLGIELPLPISDRSERDQSHPMLAESFSGIKFS